MKRKEFLITSDAGHHAIKYAWNSSLREVESLVGEVAHEEATTYRLIDKASTRVGAYFEVGHRTWQAKNGKTIRFDIRRQK